MALLSRGQSGKGQCIDVALYESAFSLMESHVAPYQMLGKIAMRAGSRLPGSTPNNLYAVQDGHVALAAASDSVFRRLAAVMQQPALGADPRFATGLARVRNQDALDEIISAWTRSFTLAGLTALLQANDVPASRIFTMADIFEDPHYAARGTIARVADGAGEPIAMPAPVPRLSDTPGEIRHAGRSIGADTAAVLHELVGVGADELARLHAAGVIFGAGRPAPAQAQSRAESPQQVAI
jgi:crotonobetainyl-CoA:carnitine CoA-transferase CaiB-like acyl-CoA transferase